MQLPYLSSNLLVWIDPAEKFVNKTLSQKTLSVLNRINGNPARQFTEDKKPLWNKGAINNTPGLLFNGGQRLTLDLPATSVSSRPLSIIFAAQFDVITGGIALEVGNSNNASLAGLGMGFDTGSDLIEPYIFSDALTGSTLSVNQTLDNRAHVWSLVFDMHRMITRLDGVAINETPISNIKNFQFNSLTLGDITFDSPNDLEHFYFTGALGTVLIYQGNQIHSLAEDFVSKTINI